MNFLKFCILVPGESICLFYWFMLKLSWIYVVKSFVYREILFRQNIFILATMSSLWLTISNNEFTIHLHLLLIFHDINVENLLLVDGIYS